MLSASVGLLVVCVKSFWGFGCVKAPGLNDRKRHCIGLILCLLRSFNRGSFHASRNPKNFLHRLLGGFFLLLFPLTPSYSIDHDAEMTHVGAAKFGSEKVDRIHVNGSAILDGTKVGRVLKVRGNLEAFEADINNLKLHGSAIIKKSTIHVRARINGDLKAEDSSFKNGIAASDGHLALSNVTSGPIDFQRSEETPTTQKLTLTNGTVIQGSVTFESGRGEIYKDKTSKIQGDIIGSYTLKEI